MIRNWRLRFVYFVLGISLFGYSGCASTEKARFYTLSPLTQNESQIRPKPSDKGPVVGIKPIKLPDYLERPQIVTRTGQNEIEIAEFDRWAGSLKEDLSRVLAENLSMLLSTDLVLIFPWQRTIPIEYTVDLEIIRFDGKLSQNVSLSARWVIYRDSDTHPNIVNKSTIIKPTEGVDYKALVAAKSYALGDLSKEIANVIYDLSRKQ